MFLVDWVYGVLNWLGLFQKDAKIVFLGLDNAGKTTLVHMLTYDKMSSNQPTTHPGQEEMMIGNCKVRAIDLGGHEAARKVWDSYFPAVDAVVYFIDSHDRERFPEAKKELDKLLSTESLANVPFLILGNKIDIHGAANEQELRHSLGLMETTGRNNFNVGKDTGVRPIELFMCSIVKKFGYPEGFQWLLKFV